MRKRKTHNGFLWAITYLAFIVFIISVAAMDSDTYIPAVTAFVSLAWLAAFGIANEERW